MNIEVAGSTLSITEEEVSYQGRSLKTADIDRVRYGIATHGVRINYLIPIRTSRSYSVDLKDRFDRELKVEFATHLALSSTIGAKHRDALNALWPIVTVPIINRLLEALYTTERGFTIGYVSFSRSGLAKNERSRRHAGDLETYLPWSEFRCAVHDGAFWIFRTTEKKKWALSWELRRGVQHWASLPLKSTWNAVCLPYVYEAITQPVRS